MEYLTGTCVTTLQGYENEVWPTVFHPNLAIGHFVEAKSGRKLMVAHVTHLVEWFEARLGMPCGPGRPVITIELCDFGRH